MPISAYGGGWTAIKEMKVWDQSWDHPVKKVKVWDQSWRLAWVPPVKVATLSLSKTGVTLSEAYNVTLTVPGGFPEGATVKFRFTGYLSGTYSPTEGATTSTLTGASHTVSGNYAWYADVTTMGGNTTFGPVTQGVAVPVTTATVTGPTWVISTQSGAGKPADLTNTIQPAVFTLGLSTPTSVSRVSFQMWHASAGWQEYAAWDNPTATSWTWTQPFATNGAWSTRLQATQKDSVVITSAEKAITCYIKNLYTGASSTTPVTGSTITMTPYCSADCNPGQSAQGWYYHWRDGNDNGQWNHYTANPGAFNWVTGGDLIDWVYYEQFNDGSGEITTLWAAATRVDITAAPPTHISTDSGSYGGTGGGTGLVNAMRDARSAGLPLWVYGTWNLSLDAMYIPDGVTVVCQSGATFNHTPMARLKNAAKWPATNMPNSTTGYNGGTFSWTGGTFNGGGDGIFTLSHSPGYTITGCYFYNYVSTADTGHAIENNSSGGADQNGAAYTIQITNNEFRGTSMGQRANGNDEACHYDFAWAGSGCDGAEDHTMCANIRVAGNTFHRVDESGSYAFALVAIGGHRMAGGEYSVVGNYGGLANPSNGEPSERHNWFLIESNGIHGAVGASAGVSPDKGAVALWNLRDTIVRNNNFYGCTDTRLVSGWDATQNLNSAACNLSISGNAHNGTGKTITMPASNTTGG